MKCSKCQHENPENSLYCGKCASPLHPETENKKSKSITHTLQTPVDELGTGTNFGDRYQVIEELGKGGMGKVYKVYDTEIQEKIALKLLKPEIAGDQKTVERFRNELRLARKIGHKNVCRMFDLNRHEGSYFITMEYISGENLKSFINRVGQLPVAKAVSIAQQVCEGLTEAHRLGVIHRDLKPQNIMIDRQGNARIMDFGIARSVKSKGITEAGIMIGTPEYLSPEQAEAKNVDHRSDLYTVGIILYEMLTGSVPFDGETPLSVAMKHKTETPRDPKELNPQIPVELSGLILKCMEKDRNRRYQKTEELLADLKQIRKNLPTTEIRPARQKPVTSKEITVTFNLKKILIPTLVVVFIAVIAALAGLFQFGSGTILVAGDKPSLAVMYFRNNTGEKERDHWRNALPELLITDLSQSKYLRILSMEKIYNILEDLDQLEATTYSTDVIREVGERGGAEKVLVGSYTKAEETYRINCSLLNARTGELIASESVEGSGEASFYPMVDELTRKIKSNFKMSDTQIAADLDRKVETITTRSPEAIKLYSKGRIEHLSGEYIKSLSEMQKALKIDPEFAMAHRSVAMSYHNLGYFPAKKIALQKAFELRDRVSEKERYIIEGDYYRASEKTQGKAIKIYQKILEDYPGDLTATANLTGLFTELGRLPEALKINKENIKLGISNWITHNNLAEAYMANGLFKEAVHVIDAYREKHPGEDKFSHLISLVFINQGKYERALLELDKDKSPEKKLDTSGLKGDIYYLKGDLKKAEMEYLKIPESSKNRRTSQVVLKLTGGKFQEAAALLEQKPAVTGLLGRVYPKAGRYDEALQIYDDGIKNAIRNESTREHIHYLHLKGLAYLGKGDMETSRKIAGELKELTSGCISKNIGRFYKHLNGRIKLSSGQYSDAIADLKGAVALLPITEDMKKHEYPLFLNSLAEAYFKSGDLEKAEKTYQKIQSLKMSRLLDGDLYAKSFYWLGKIYQQNRRKLEAVDNYQQFLDLWKSADPGLSEVEDAKKQIASLML